MEAQEKNGADISFVRRMAVFLVILLTIQAIFIAICIIWQANVFTSNRRVSVFPNNLLIAMVIGYAVQFSAVILGITRFIKTPRHVHHQAAMIPGAKPQPKMSNPYLPPGY